METQILVTEKEKELIEAIRGYKNSKHNPSKMLKLYAMQIFDEIIREN